jgi:hypothetical protein
LAAVTYCAQPAARQRWTAASSSLQPRADAAPILSRSRSSGIQPIAVVTARMIIPTARVATTALTKYSFQGPGMAGGEPRQLAHRITILPACDQAAKNQRRPKREMSNPSFRLQFWGLRGTSLDQGIMA